ncbi:MAG: GIY-YIG nuclease family protein [Hymenobacter sp.]|nr:MAG: GIY-YIG nuclease family protein [Hymenobacter sp.]
MSTTYIYTLADPHTGEVRYVGKDNDLKLRLKAHCNPARKRQSHKKAWVQSLLKQGQKPRIEVLEQVPMTEWPYWEEYWIRQLRAWGMRLTNHTLGGDGATHANAGSYRKGEGKVPVVQLTIGGQFVARHDCAADTGLLMQQVLDKPGKAAKGYLWLREATWREMGEAGVKAYVESFACEEQEKVKRRAQNTGKFQKGHVTWNTGNGGYTTAKKGSIVSDQVKQKISKTLTGRTNTAKSEPVDQLSKDGTLVTTYPSAAEAKRVTGIKGILNVIHGTANSAGGFKWQKSNIKHY